MNKKLTLLVCSNRTGIKFSNIWKEIIEDKNLEKIVLVTQGKANNYVNRQTKVVHIKLTNTGRSNAVNAGLKEITSEFIGLTDDDCFLNKDWVQQAIKLLKRPSVSLVFGQTFPYKPEKHKNMICPCTFTKTPNKYSLLSHIYTHWTDVGFDNNAVIKRRVFDKIGGYKWWLGPGSIGKNAEDAEFILRSIIAKYKIAYNPSMIVYHNKWLTQKEWKQAWQIYLCGGIAAYGLYAIQGAKMCQPVVKSYISEVIQEFKSEINRTLRKQNSFNNLIKDTSTNFYFICRGLIIAFLFAKIISIPGKENVSKFIKNYNRLTSSISSINS